MSEAGEKRVGWAELFFDLVFVVAVTRAAELLEHDHHAVGLLRAATAFVPAYWLWVGTAVQTNLNDTDRLGMRLKIMGVALAGVFLAVAMPQAYERGGLVFALAYWGGRVLLGWRYVRRLNPYTVSIVLTGPMLIIGALLEPGPRVAVWAVAGVVDLASPSLLRRRLARMHYDADHLAERFGLFVLIALGETVVAVGSEGDLEAVRLLAVAAAFAVVVGLWWVYFYFAADAVRHALATAQVQLDIFRTVLSYGHLIFIGAIVAVSVGLHDAVAEPAHHLAAPVVGLLYGGAALYLAAFGLTRWAMFRLVSKTRLITAGVVLALAPVAVHLPAVAALGLLALVLVALNAVELRAAGTIGWRARLHARGG